MRARDYLLLATMPVLWVELYAADFPEYRDKPAAAYAGAKTMGEVAVGVEALSDPAAQKYYFKVDFAKKGFLPVFVVVENASSTDSFILKREDIGVYRGTEEQSKSDQVTSGRSKAGENLMLASTIALSMAGMLVASHMMVKATEIRQNLIKKELRSSTLTPKHATRGFVYIPLPSDTSEGAPLRMRVRVVKLGDDQPMDFEFPIGR